jgi:hypothetical protein
LNKIFPEKELEATKPSISCKIIPTKIQKEQNMNKKNRIKLALIGLTLFVISLACQSLFPKGTTPGSIQEEIANGNVRFEGKGNLSYGECQDPTAAVTVTISVPTKEYEGQEFYDPVNPVTVTALTDGALPWSGNCEKSSLDEKHNWPAKGLYYAKEEKILFYRCSLTDGKAEGTAYLNGEGTDLYFEGEYGCFGEDGSLVYSVAFSVFRVDN